MGSLSGDTHRCEVIVGVWAAQQHYIVTQVEEALPDGLHLLDQPCRRPRTGLQRLYVALAACQPQPSLHRQLPVLNGRSLHCSGVRQRNGEDTM
jgi:hypothetical protein